jgi:hypothetical protein
MELDYVGRVDGDEGHIIGGPCDFAEPGMAEVVEIGARISEAPKIPSD